VDPQSLPLGRQVAYPRDYDPSLLFPIARAHGRSEIGIGETLPFIGFDRWFGYELSWLDPRGKPVVATLTLEVPATTPYLVESKSLKLYLNSFNATRFGHADEVLERITGDLGAAAGGAVRACFGIPPAQVHEDAICIDDIDLAVTHYGPPDASLLTTHADAAGETLVSHLLKSNCPVTGQPDWASLRIGYHGPRIDRAGLLRYIASFRDHCEFHEQCVERIFVDMMARCRPRSLSVEARYTRRGGLDINPWRGTPDRAPPAPARDLRQ
jgi:7-cyano-7-deazaguanine reductase